MSANHSRQAQGYPRLFPHPPFIPLNNPWVRPAMLRDVHGLSWNLNEPARMSSAIFAERHEKGKGPLLAGGPVCCYSCSFRAFFRLRFRAKASFTRLFSPGFK